MAGFDISYNGVNLLNILTTTLEPVPVRDESGTDIWYTEITFGVSTIVNVAVFTAVNQSLGVTGNRVQGATAADTCRNALQRLLEDRMEFVYRQNGVEMFRSNAQIDANNGPKVVSAHCKPMGTNSIKIDFVVKIAIIGCSESPPPVTGNRFTVSDPIDDQHRTTRTWRGRIRLSNAIHNVHAFREVVVPLLSDGFRRKHLHFQGELNALELSYEIQDVQLLGDAAPAPAVKMTGTHTETLDRSGSASVGEVYVRLEGAPGTDKQVLLEQCMKVINSRVQADRFANQKNNWIWLELVITDFLGEDICAVEARARVRRSLNDADAAGGGSLRLGNMVLNTLGRPLDLGGDYSRFRTLPPSLYPCTTAGLFSAALQCPCDEHGMPQVGERIGEATEPGRDSEEPTVVTYDPTGAPFEIESPGLSSAQTDAMYTFSEVNWAYDLDEGIVPMPMGDQLPGSSATVAHIRLHAPTAKVTMRVSAERIGDFPSIPIKQRFTDGNGITYVPLKYRPVIRPIEYQGDGRKLYVIDLEATYSLSRSPGPTEFIVPALPWDNLETTTVPSNAFQPALGSK